MRSEVVRGRETRAQRAPPPKLPGFDAAMDALTPLRILTKDNERRLKPGRFLCLPRQWRFLLLSTGLSRAPTPSTPGEPSSFAS
jgi:hypothetical protein